jgi:mono/diheme cytochrome c family protein
VVSYTTEQAERGRQVFSTICSACHAISEFRGQLFQTTWRSLPIADFYQFISTAMPQDMPGSLRPEQYAAVVAHVLQLNGVAPGATEVPADARALQGVPWPR